MENFDKHIYVDADSCPVKNEVIRVAEMQDIYVVFVSSYAHELTLPSFVNKVTVDADKEAVDLYIINHIHKGDICVTQDHALASLLLAKGVFALSPKGYEFKEEMIQQLLDYRFLSQKERRMGGRTKGPKAFTKADRQNFTYSLEKIIKNSRNIKENSEKI